MLENNGAIPSKGLRENDIELKMWHPAKLSVRHERKIKVFSNIEGFWKFPLINPFGKRLLVDVLQQIKVQDRGWQGIQEAVTPTQESNVKGTQNNRQMIRKEGSGY